MAVGLILAYTCASHAPLGILEGIYLREVRGARDAMPEPSVCAQPDMLRLDSAVSSDRGARSALRLIPWQCCSFSAVSPVRLPSGCSLYRHMTRVRNIPHHRKRRLLRLAVPARWCYL